ncbi:MAG TPA: PqiC family protein [Candidatus Margulisiibacteriota bacterium]|nr:PqiC family protein [Candidatus Margulisiibacteriota bacterium]
MSQRTGYQTASILIAGAWLWSCSLLAPQPDVSRFYTLNAVADAGVSGGGARGLTYGLGPIELPPYLDRTELAMRVSPAEVTYAPTDLWAESLKTNLTRVLQQNLSTLLGGEPIVLYPWPRASSVSYQIAVTVLQFERTATGEAQLHARWSIRDARRGAEVASKESSFVHPVAPATAVAAVNALSADVGDLSQEIAAALQSLPVPQSPHRPR